MAQDKRLLLQYTYAYGPDGLISTVKEWSPHGEKTVSYTYDTVQRLITVEDSKAGKTTYRYTKLGNRIELAAPGQPSVASTYDWAGRLVSHHGQPCTHDGAGNLTSCGTAPEARTLVYNTANLLQSAAAARGTVRYQYDGDGYLIERTVDDRRTSYVPDPLTDRWQPMLSTDDTGMQTYFIWDGNGLLATIAGDDVRFFLHDQLGSVRGELDKAGKLTAQFDYDPFGQPRQQQATQRVVPGFARLFFDPTAAVYLAHARAYDPALGRFLQIDPQFRVPYGSPNDLSPYTYGGNDPVNYLDASGRDREAINPFVMDWPKTLRDMEQQLQVDMSRRLITQPDATVHKLADDIVEKVFEENALLQQMAQDVLKETRETPPGTPVDLRRIVLNRLRQHVEGRIAEAIDKHIQTLLGIPQPDLRDTLKDRVLEYVESHLAPHTGELDIFEAVRDDPSGYTYKHALQDINTVFGKFAQNRQALAQTLRNQLRSARLTLPRSSVPTQALGVATGAFSSVIESVITGAQAVDVIGRSMQAMNAPVNLQDRSWWGWEGHTQRALNAGGRYERHTQMSTFDLPDLPRLRGNITRLDMQKVMTDFGTMERRSLSTTRASGIAERLMLHAYPVQDYFDPQHTSSITTTRSRMQYRETTRGGIRRIEPLAQDTPLQPAPVGGVFLRGAGEALTHLGALSGIAIDETSGGLVLLAHDKRPISLPPLRLDDVVTIFRAVYQGHAPSVSIDPDPRDPQGPVMHVRHGFGMEDTYVSWVLFEADRIMKAYSLGQDNVTATPVTSHVPGYRHLLDAAFWGDGTGASASTWERFWIVPAQVQRQQTRDRQLTLFDVPLKVNTEQMAMRQGSLVTAAHPQSSLGATTFATWFTTQYDAIATEVLVQPPRESGIDAPVPVFAELRRLALIAAIAETLREQGVPIPAWMQDYQVQAVPVTPTTPALVVQAAQTEVQHSTQRNALVTREITRKRHIYGGVNLAAADKDVHTTQAAPQAEAVAPAVFKAAAATPPLSPISVQQGGRAYQAVMLPGNASHAVGGQRLEEADLVVPVQGDSQLALVRTFHSFFQPSDVFGGRWTLNLPRLDAQLQPVSRTAHAGQYRTVHQLTSPLNTWSARFAEKKPVPELGGEFLVPDRPGGILALASAEDKRIGRKTHVVLFCDGRRWHFDAAGNHVAWTTAPLTVVYRRDGMHRIRRIEGWYGEHLRADIQLNYDAHGRLTSAVGSDGSRVTYSYDTAGHLATVARPHGTVGYSYKDGLVTAIEADGMQTRRFAYNARGQLQQAWFNDGTTVNYASHSTPPGIEITGQRQDVPTTREAVQYDQAFRPVHRTFADGTQVQWRYQGNGEAEMTVTLPQGGQYLVSQSADGTQREVQRPEGGIYTTTVDASGRLTTVQQNGRPVLRQQWRSDGQLAAAVYETVAVHPEYRADGVLQGVTFAAPGQGPRPSHWRHFALDERGQVTEVTDASGTKIQLGYDTAGSPLVFSSPRGTARITRNNRGDVSEIATTWGYGQKNTYAKKDGMLTKMHLVQGKHAASIEIDRGKPRQVRQFDGGVMTLAYDNAGLQNGSLKEINLPQDLKLRYAYNAANRLSRIDIGEAYRVEYSYDAQGRLVGLTWAPL